MTAPAAGRSRARLLVPLGLGTGLSLFGAISLYAGLVPRIGEVGLTMAQVGVLFSIHRFLRIPGNPLAGALIDRFGRRPLFLAGLSLGVISTVLYALAPGFGLFLFARLLWGSAWALINVGGMTMILDIAAPDERGRLSGYLNAGLLAGYAAGPVIGGFLIDQIGFFNAMLACAAISAVGLIVALPLLPETRPTRPNAETAALPNPFVTLWRALQTALRASPAVAAALLLFGVTVFGGDGVLLSTTSLLIQQRLGNLVTLDGVQLGVATASGVLIAVFALLAGITGPLAGRLSDRSSGRVPVIAAALLCGLLCFGGLIFARSLPLVLVCIALGAVSYGAGMTAITAYMGDHAPAGGMGAIMGAFATAGDAGAAFGPVLSFALIPLIGLDAVYALTALIFLAGLALLVRR